MSSYTTVFTDTATPPGGHYSQAVSHNGLVYISGQLGFEPGTSEPGNYSVEQQTKHCIKNLENILLAAGSDLGKVLKTTVYISDVALWPRVNAAYAEAFGDLKPARAIVPCNTLHHGFEVEIEAIAVQ